MCFLVKDGYGKNKTMLLQVALVITKCEQGIGRILRMFLSWFSVYLVISSLYPTSFPTSVGIHLIYYVYFSELSVGQMWAVTETHT